RLADVWQKYVTNIPLIYVLSTPRKSTERAQQLFLEEVREMRHRLEKWAGVEITDAALRQAISLFNHFRQLLRELYEMKKGDRPPITGAETLEVINAAFRMPKDEYVALLERLLEEINATGRVVKAPLRLMITGSPLNNPEFIKVIESQGALVVVDELCMGTRYWWGSVEETKYPDPLEAISRRYLSNFPCARMVPCDDRFDKVLGLARDYRVDGVVSQIIRYCVPYAHDQPLLRERLEATGVPVLELDTEYGMAGTGQIMTRAQAFLEMLQAKKIVVRR
ncbi:MAG: 2-hydroxyacyl-CoA dehydratase family protein, partial [Dehalococcoidia bacterium]|nr:2-hydroxyacyl-CoA dehydratase family protein [Dehalococcoidia bacterium]